MIFKGLHKTSLVDYPEKIAATLFVGGCNLRCPFCHNRDLVLGGELPDISEAEVLLHLGKRKRWLDGVCVSGGEPTLHKDLPVFLDKVKKLGFLIKLDTNGTNPGLLLQIVEGNLADYVAMDIKASLQNYDRTCGVSVDKKAIQESIDIIRKGSADYEFRTTAVPGFFDGKEARAIGRWLKGSKRYALQQFRPLGTIDPGLTKTRPFASSELRKFGEIMKPYFSELVLRGAD
ncbi:MAG: anaerobic ribonucleoside-triphosphate reductase activating protein [archaeon]